MKLFIFICVLAILLSIAVLIGVILQAKKDKTPPRLDRSNN